MVVDRWTQKRVLITVRTYPTPAAKGAEVSCTAGITTEGQWIRLFPIPYRRLDREQKFSKYDWVDVRILKAADHRPESYNVDLDSIQRVGKIPPDAGWQARMAVISPLKAHCLCCLKTQRDAHQSPTLGFFKPKWIRRLIIEPDRDDWTPEERAKLQQMSLFDKKPMIELQKIPFRFRYEFVCDEPDCPSHTLSCTDWEMGESFRSWRKRYGSNWEEKFREKFEEQMLHKNDTHFFVGTLHQHPATWIIIGLFYPRR